MYSLALRLRNTKVPVWTHQSIGYPKMDISHWDAAIHNIGKFSYCRSPPVYCDQTQIIMSLKEPENGHHAIWHAYPIDHPRCVFPHRDALPTLGLTKVPVWTHESIGYPEMDISHWDAAIQLWPIQIAPLLALSLRNKVLWSKMEPDRQFNSACNT